MLIDWGLIGCFFNNAIILKTHHYIISFVPPLHSKGFCQVKINPKIREKLGSGWMGEALTRILFLLLKFCVFLMFFVLFSYLKKQDV